MNVPRTFRPRLNWWILAWWLEWLIFPIRGADPNGDVALLDATQTLTNPATIRGLTQAQALAGIPVEVVGVITWLADNSSGGFLDDGTAPVWIEGKLPEGVRAGSRLRVRGKTNPGSFTPTVILTNAPEILGTLELPVPREVLGRDLQLGKWDGFRVTFGGTAFWCQNPIGEREVRVLNDGVPIVVIGLGTPPENLPLPRPVRVTGLSSLAIENRMPVDAQLLVNSWSDLSFAGADSANLLPELWPIASLTAATNPASLDRYVRIQGVVTWRASDKYAIQDATGGLMVRATNGLVPELSRQVELTGSLQRAPTSLEFVAAAITTNKSGALPPPVLLATRQDLLDRSNRGRRVSLEGLLVHRRWISRSQEWVVVSAEQQESFRVVFAPDVDLFVLDRLRFGSTIQVTGVLQRDLELPGRASEARLLVASVADVRFISPPPLSRRLVFWLAVTALAALVAVAVVSIWWRHSDRVVGLKHAQLARENQLQRRFAQIAETASDLIVTLNHAGRITSINPAGQRLIANTNTQMLGRAYANWIAPAHRERWLQSVGRAAAGEEVPPFELVVQRADGSTLEFEVLLRQLDEVELQCIGRDLTERRRAAELAEQAARWQRLHIEQTPLGIVQFDEAGIIRAWNPAAARIFGWRAEEILGQSWKKLVPKEHHHEVQTAVWDIVLRAPEVVPHVNPNSTADGRIIECEWLNNPLTDNSGRIIGITALVTDVTVARRTQHELVYREQQLRAIVDSMAEGIVVLGNQRQVLSINRAAEQILGVQRRGFVGSIWPNDWDCQLADGSRLPPQDHPIVRTMESGRATDAVMFSFLAGDGVRRWLSLNSRVVARQVSGSVEQVIATFTDITATRTAEQQRQRLEDQLHHSEKLRALGTLAGGVAHDFNNLLASILGNSELIQLDLPADHPAAQQAREIGEVAQRGAELVRRVLSFSRPQPARRVSLRLSEVVNDSLKVIVKALPPGVGLQCDFDPVEPCVLGDPSQLCQVVVNLCTNAAHAMEEGGGTLTVEVTALYLTDTFVAANPPLLVGPAVRLRIRDTGMGMAPTTVARAFEPFFSTKAPGRGTGLGLAIVHNIVETHQGRVRIDSAIGRGTTIDVLLPVVLAENGHPEAVAGPEASPPGEGEELLVVDDDLTVLRFLEQALHHLSYRATIIRSPKAALIRFRETSERFQLVLTDLSMPELSGLDLARAIRAIRPDLPVIIATGYGPDTLEQLATVEKEFPILEKPFKLPELARLLRAHLTRRS